MPDASPGLVADKVETPAKDGIRLNFQGAALSDVLNYLSEAAGFVIVQDTPVTGTVNVVSKQPLNTEEAVDLLNAVLGEKGYTAIRNGRILKIVSRKDAQTKDIPVVTGSDPSLIPRKDEMVTQILPVRFVEAAKLVDNLRPLLDPNSTITANESSNAILLTDTQTNVRRIAEIIRALDTSISSISTIHVYQLRYADSKDLAKVITDLFSSEQPKQDNQPGGFPGFGGFRRMFGGGGGNATPPPSPARQAASRVVAVADEQSNSVIVSAPDEIMATISEIVSRVDTNISDATETRIFRLLHADAVELATILTGLYGDDSSSSQSGNRNNGNQNNQQRPPWMQPPPRSSDGASQRSLLQARVVTVPDARTNSVIVSCSRDTMEQIALTVGRLDSSDSKKQHIYVHTLEHADPENVAAILRGMFSVDSNSNMNQPSTSRLTDRTANGASSGRH